MYIFEPISTEDILKRLSVNCRLRRLEKNISQKSLYETSVGGATLHHTAV